MTAAHGSGIWLRPAVLILVNDAVTLGFPFEMRNVQISYRINGGDDRGITFCIAARATQLAPYLSQRSQHAGAVESLSFAVFAEAHLHILRRDGE